MVPHTHNITMFLPLEQMVLIVGVEWLILFVPHGCIVKRTTRLPIVRHAVLTAAVMAFAITRVTAKRCLVLLGNEDAISPLRMGIMINVGRWPTFYFHTPPLFVIPANAGIQVIMMSCRWHVLFITWIPGQARNDTLFYELWTLKNRPWGRSFTNRRLWIRTVIIFQPCTDTDLFRIIIRSGCSQRFPQAQFT